MTTWPSSSAASSSPPDFTAHALSRPPRKKPEPFSQPGRQAEHDQQKLRNTSDPVGAENCDTASDQGVQCQRADLAVTVHSPRGPAPRCGLPTRVPAARPRVEPADAARPLRRSQGRRDPGPPSRNRRAAPTPPAREVELGRPCPAQCVEPTPTSRSATAAARLTQDAAALARPARRPPLDLFATTTRPTAHRATGSGVGAADGPGEPDVGLPPRAGRTCRTRPPDCGVHRLDNPQEGRPRSGSATLRPDLAPVPGRTSSRDPRGRLRPR